jgi:hypothetical protein
MPSCFHHVGVNLKGQAASVCEVQALPPTSGRLLGFMWTSCANSQFVIVTTLGLKCFMLGKQALHSSKACKALEDYANTDLGDVVWYKYQHYSRILIMATQFDLAVLQITGQVRMLGSPRALFDSRARAGIN